MILEFALLSYLCILQLEKVRVERESEDRLDSQAQRYEERLTELHSVIAELSRKIDQQRINVIAEEEVAVEEYSQSELSHDQHEATGKDELVWKKMHRTLCSYRNRYVQTWMNRSLVTDFVTITGLADCS